MQFLSLLNSVVAEEWNVSCILASDCVSNVFGKIH